MNEEQKKYELNKGLTVLILLMAATLGEYLIGRFAFHWWAPLLTVAVLKAYLILRDYMHIGKVLAGDEAEVH